MASPASYLAKLYRSLLVPVAAFVVVAAYLGDDIWRERQRIIGAELESLDIRTQVVGVALDTNLRAIERELGDIAAQRLALGEAGAARLAEEIEQRLGRLDHVLSLMVLDAEGRIAAHTNRSVTGFDASFREHYTAHRDGTASGLHVSLPFVAFNKQAVISFSRAIVGRNGEFRGVAAAAINLETLGQMLGQVLDDASVGIALVNPAGRVIHRLPDPERHADKSVAASPAWQAHRAAGGIPSRHQVTNSLDGVPRLVVLRDVGRGKLTLIASRDTDATLASWRRQTQMRLGMLSLFALTLLSLRYLLRLGNREKRRLEARYQAMVEHTDDVFVVFDTNGIMRYASPGLTGMTGVTPDAVLGRHFTAFAHHDDLARVEAVWRDMLAAPGRQYRLNFRVATTTRGWIEVEALATGHFHTPGIEGGLLTVRDIHERALAAQNLQRSEDNLKRAQAVAHIGSWTYSEDGGRIEWSDETYRIFGMPPGTPLNSDEVIRRVHPDDRDSFKAAWRAARNSGDYDFEHRIVVNGKTVWVREKADLAFDASGRLLHATGTLQDISEARDAALRMAELLEFTEKIIASSPIGIAVYQADGPCVMTNEAMARIVGATPEQVRAQDFRRIPSWRSLGLLDAAMETLQSGQPVRKVVNGRSSFQREVSLDCEFVAITRRGEQHLLLLARDIAEFHAAERALKQSIQLAEESNRMKSEFLANMSHEIRTPMNAVIGLAQLALDQAQEPLLRDYLRQMNNSASTLLDVINDILDYSKIEAGRITLERREFSLGEIADRLRGMFDAPATAKGLRFSIEIASGLPPRLLGDAMRLNQVLINLVGNAIKFTADGSIALEIGRAPHSRRADHIDDRLRLRFVVNDSGIGMDSATLANLFLPFSQGDGSITRRFGGTGLGLSISRRLVLLMGGDISVESRAGEGSQFHFDLDFALPHALGGDTLEARPGLDALSVNAASIAGARVLLVEDDPVNRRVTGGLLGQAGLHVVTANDGVEALACLQREDFDAVLMDLQLPKMDGFEACRHIRAEARWAALPIIAFTAAVLLHDRDKCLAAGMNDYVAKPAKPDELLAALVRQIAPRQAAAAPPQAAADVPTTAAANLASLRLRAMLLALSPRLADHDFISAGEIGNLRSAIAALGERAVRDAGERLEDALSRYDYAAANRLLSALSAALEQAASRRDEADAAPTSRQENPP